MRALVLLVALAACGKSDKSDNPMAAGGSALATAAAGGPSGGPRDAVLDAWKKGGLTPSAFTPAQTMVGKDCQSGTVGAVDALICVFASPQEAKLAEDTGLGWVGDTTGMAQAHGAVLVVAADRRKSDPSGRTINQMMKLAPK